MSDEQHEPDYLVLPWIDGLALMVRTDTVKRIEYQADGKTLSAVEFVTRDPMTIEGAPEWKGDNVMVRLVVHEDDPYAD